MDEVRVFINILWTILFLSISIYFIRKAKDFPDTDRGYPVLVIGFVCLTTGSILATLFVMPKLFQGLFTAEEVRHIYIIADVIRALGAIIVINGVLIWGRALRNQYKIIHEKITLENRVSKQSDLLASQSRDLEVRTIDYLEQKESAIEAERSKTNFLRNTSHEFRTPLNAIIGLSDLLVEGKAKSPEEQREFAKMISDSGRKLLKIIDTLLDIARIKSGEYVANPKPASLREVIDQCTTLLLPKAHAKSIRFHHIPENGENILAIFDTNATHHILTKILDNALTYSPNDSSITIEIDQRDEQFTKVLIKDEGPGIPAEHIRNAFEIFGRAERWQHRGDESSGLGLALSVKMAQIQNGKLEIQSDGTNGTACILSLPAYKENVLKIS